MKSGGATFQAFLLGVILLWLLAGFAGILVATAVQAFQWWMNL